MPGSPDTVPAPDLPSGSRCALVIVTTAYSDRELRQLRAPAQDAQDLTQVLADPEIGGFTVTSVINKSAHAIRMAVENFLADRGTGDVLLLYLSCHGLLNAHRRLYFAAKDTRKKLLGSTGVEAAWVMDQLEHCRARQQILILDSCFSGAFDNTKGDADVGLSDRFTGQGRGRIVLTASTATEYSYEGKPIEGAMTAGSVFTSALVDGLRTGAADANHDGHVTVEEAYAYAYDQVRAAGAGQTPQRWAYKSEGSIVLARSPAGRVLALPEALRLVLDSTLPSIRIAAIGELKALLNGGDPAQEQAARTRLREMADRDIPEVAAAARALLLAGQTPAKTHNSAAEATTGQSKPKASRAKTAASGGTAPVRERRRQATGGNAAAHPEAVGALKPEHKTGTAPARRASGQQPSAASQSAPANQKPPAASQKGRAANQQPPGASPKPSVTTQKAPTTSRRPSAANQKAPASDQRPAASPATKSSPPSAAPATGSASGIPSRPLRALAISAARVNGLAFSPDGKLLATGTGNSDAAVLLWDPLTGQLLRTLASDTVADRSLEAMHRNEWMAFSPDGRQFATNVAISGVNFSRVRFWDPNTGRSQHDFRVRGFGKTAGFSPDGRRFAVACSDGTVNWYNPATGQRLNQVKLVRPSTMAMKALKLAAAGSTRTDSYSSMMFSPGLRALAAGRHDGTLELWNPETGERQGAFLLRQGRPANLAGRMVGLLGGPQILGFSPDGALIIVRDSQPFMKPAEETPGRPGGKPMLDVRSVADGALRLHVPGMLAAGAAFRPDGRVLGTGQGRSVVLSDPATGKELAVLEPQGASGSGIAVSCLAFGPHGGMIAVAESQVSLDKPAQKTGRDASVRVWT